MSGVTARIARQRGLGAASLDALHLAVVARLCEDDYSVLRRYRDDASLETYLAVVASRVLRAQRGAP